MAHGNVSYRQRRLPHSALGSDVGGCVGEGFMWLLRWKHCKVLNTGPGRVGDGWAEVRALVSWPSVPAPGWAVSNGHSGTPRQRGRFWECWQAAFFALGQRGPSGGEAVAGVARAWCFWRLPCRLLVEGCASAPWMGLWC